MQVTPNSRFMNQGLIENWLNRWPDCHRRACTQAEIVLAIVITIKDTLNDISVLILSIHILLLERLLYLVYRYLFHRHVQEIGQSRNHVSSWDFNDLAIVVILLEIEIKEVPLILRIPKLQSKLSL